MEYENQSLKSELSENIYIKNLTVFPLKAFTLNI